MRKILILLIVLIIISGVSLFFLPDYIPRALLYNYVGIDDYTIFHNREIKALNPAPWKKNLTRKELSKNAVHNLYAYKTIAFLVVRDNAIIYEQYNDGYTDTSHTNSFSMAKSIVGLLIGAAIDDGLVKNIDQPVGDFLPEYNNGENAMLSIKHLLTMSSGLNWDESYSALTSITTQAYYGNDLKDLMSDIKVEETPGRQFEYKSGATQLLAIILEKVTGKTLSEYASIKLWGPINAQQKALWSLDRKNGYEKAYCCFNSNARDFARLGQLVLNKGKWNNKQVISSKYIKESITPAFFLQDKNGKPVDFYGYQWWIMYHKGFQIPYMRGLNGQYVFVIPELNAVVVRLGHCRSELKIQNTPVDAYLWLNTALEIINN